MRVWLLRDCSLSPRSIKYNMVNEPGHDPTTQAISDMAAAHLLDPTSADRLRLRFPESGHGPTVQTPHAALRPDATYDRYCDQHNPSASSGSYTDSEYFTPTLFVRSTKDPTEIFVWGEENAVASPPQLATIQTDIAQAAEIAGMVPTTRTGTMRTATISAARGLTPYYPSLTNPITSMAAVSYYAARKALIENARIADDADMYIMNGYEDMKLDNLSGIVDVFRVTSRARFRPDFPRHAASVCGGETSRQDRAGGQHQHDGSLRHQSACPFLAWQSTW